MTTLRDETPDDLDELTARYLAGEMTQAEKGDFLRAAERDSALARGLETSGKAWREAVKSETYDVDAAWHSLSQRIREDVRNGIVQLPVARNWRNSASILRYAAVLVVAVGLVTIWRVSGAPSDAAITQVASAVTSFETTTGERREIQLTDGSSVILGARSTLRVSSEFGATARDVELTGEALFTVRHDEARPFRVRTTGALVEDLGTVFSVRAIGAGTPVEVAVAEGSVGISRTSTDSPVLLTPRDRAVVGDTGEIDVTHNVDVARYYAWSTGRLMYSDTRFEDVMADLERWYDIEFQISDSTLLKRRISADYDAALPIDELLTVVGTTLESRLIRRGRVVELALPDRASLRSDRTLAGSGA